MTAITIYLLCGACPTASQRNHRLPNGARRTASNDIIEFAALCLVTWVWGPGVAGLCIDELPNLKNAHGKHCLIIWAFAYTASRLCA